MTGGEDGSARQWHTPSLLRPALQPNKVGGSEHAFSSDGKLLVTVDPTSGWMRLWDMADPDRSRQAHTFGGHTAAAGFLPGGRMLLTNDKGYRTFRLWDVTDPRRPVPLHTFTDTSASAPLEPGEAPQPSVAGFDPARHLLTLAGYVTGSVQVWNIRDPRHPHLATTLKAKDVLAADFLPRNHVLAVVTVHEDIRLYDATDPARPVPAGSIPHSALPRTLDFTPPASSSPPTPRAGSSYGT